MSALKNYTTKVPAERSLAEIQKALVGAGADSIMIGYVGGQASSIQFMLSIAGTGISFRLPVEIDKFRALLVSQKVVRAKKDHEYVRRVAWRCIRDWVLAQLALCATQMVDPGQLFLPYAMTSTGATLYELTMGGQVPLLTSGEGGGR